MTARIGVFGIGLAAYWPQFPGMQNRLERYQRIVEDRVRGFSAEVISAGLVDTPEAAGAAAQLFQREDLDLIVCHVATYATSSQVLPVVQRSLAPVLVLNLQPSAALDYETADTAEWLANCSVCCVPEIATAFARARIDFQIVSGRLQDDPAAWREIEDWCRAAAVARAVRESRIGFLGHTYPGMLDLYADFTTMHAQLGAHIEILEMDDLAKRVAAAGADEIARNWLPPSMYSPSTPTFRRAISIGPRAWPWDSTAWPRISRSTASPITIAASMATNSSAWARA